MSKTNQELFPLEESGKVIELRPAGKMKKCSWCGEVKPWSIDKCTSEFYLRGSGRPYGECKKCHKGRTAATKIGATLEPVIKETLNVVAMQPCRRQATVVTTEGSPEVPDSLKRCPQCGKKKVVSRDKDLSDFYVDRSGRVKSSCKICAMHYGQERRESAREYAESLMTPPGKCHDCGAKKSHGKHPSLTFHHLNGNGHKEPHGSWWIKASRENRIKFKEETQLLCRQCHAKRHRLETHIADKKQLTDQLKAIMDKPKSRLHKLAIARGLKYTSTIDYGASRSPQKQEKKS